MDILISEELRLLIQKLKNCQDSKTGEQKFFGQVRVELINGVMTLCVEEKIWETESGDSINTAILRA